MLRISGKVAGMANALITISTAEGGRVLLLEDVIVYREHRGRGFGRRLVEHVLDWAHGQGMTRVTLLADRENQPALDFYRRLGFETFAYVGVAQETGLNSNILSQSLQNPRFSFCYLVVMPRPYWVCTRLCVLARGLLIPITGLLRSNN